LGICPAAATINSGSTQLRIPVNASGFVAVCLDFANGPPASLCIVKSR
jgi:hypothetical protein